MSGTVFLAREARLASCTLTRGTAWRQAATLARQCVCQCCTCRAWQQRLTGAAPTPATRTPTYFLASAGFPPPGWGPGSAMAAAVGVQSGVGELKYLTNISIIEIHLCFICTALASDGDLPDAGRCQAGTRRRLQRHG